MTAKMTITVDLDAEDTEEQIEAGIQTLELLKTWGKPLTAAPKPPAAPAAAKVPTPPAAKAAAVVPKPPAAAAPATNENKSDAAGEGGEPVELDKEGLPWDVRIHSSGKTKLVKGETWKLIRKLDPAFVEEVKAELRATMDAAPAPTETTAAEAFAGGDSDEVAPLGDTPMSFPEVMNIVTTRMADGTLTEAQRDAVLTKHGLPSMPMLASRPDLIPAFATDLEAL